MIEEEFVMDEESMYQILMIGLKMKKLYSMMVP
jgi:hypothetical protein